MIETARARRRLWRMRALVLGAVALGLAIHGQRLVTYQRDISGGARWYALGIVLLVVGWLGTYRNRRVPAETVPVSVSGSPAWVSPRVGLALGALAVALNLCGVSLLRAHAYASWAGGLGWLASLVLFFVAFLGLRQHEALASTEPDPEAQAALRLSRRVEVAVATAIFALAVALRWYRLGDWTTGMHGDEGEVGVEALRILEGQRVSPFGVGWYAQPNVYYWAVALTMRVFGTGLFGLRMFALIAGSLMVPPLYLLVRSWFGVRMAILASVFLAISDVAIHFSRQQFSNITTPLFLVIGALFLFRGLRSGRYTDFIAAGYAHSMGLYFYVGGRLGPLVLIAFVVYLFLVMPAIRALTGGWRAQAAVVGRHLGRIGACLIAALCMATPWIAFYADNRETWDARVAEKLVFNNAERVASASGASHEALRVLGVTLAGDGFWPRALWSQLLATLSILTYRVDGSSVYTFTGEPIAKPLEAALIVLGIAWALWRWRDARMALLSIWFWSAVLVGGVLTIDAPYMARLVGIIPALAVFAALPLDKLASELVRFSGRSGPGPRRAAQVLSAAALVALLAFLTWQNFTDYYRRYVGPWAFTEASGQAVFVRDMKRAMAERGRPEPTFHHLAVHLIYWGYGVNRFLNYGTPGEDVANVSSSLPLVDEDRGDAVFMVWDVNAHYLPVLRAYYPEGEASRFVYGPPEASTPLLTSYRVTREEIESRRVSTATYTGPSAPPVRRAEPGLGTEQPRPASLAYPARARWDGNVFSPQPGLRRFRLLGPAGASLRLDGVLIASVEREGVAEGVAPLARGLHTLELAGSLADPSTQITVQWARGPDAWSAIPRRLLWSGPGRGLVGEVRPLGLDPFGQDPSKEAAGGARLLRVDGLLGFRDAAHALGRGAPLQARWSGLLAVETPGAHRFWLNSCGGSTLSVDGRLVVDNREAGSSPREGSGLLDLASGQHRIEVRYAWKEGIGYLEAFWQPPGQPRTILGPIGLQAAAGLPDPSTFVAPERTDDPAADDSPPFPASSRLVLETELRGPHGLAAGAGGSLYAADTLGRRVVVLDREGKVLRSWGRPGAAAGEFEEPEDIGVGRDGKVYVLDHGRSDVQVFDAAGKLERTLGEGSWCSPAGLTVAPDLRVYVAETCASRVLQYSAEGVLERAFTAGADDATRLEQPVDVAVDARGQIFVADLRDRVVELDPQTDTIRRTWPVHVGRASGAANLAASGRFLYLTDPDSGVLSRIDTARQAVERFKRLSVRPLAIALGPAGEVYVGDVDDGRIELFRPLSPAPQ